MTYEDAIFDWLDDQPEYDEDFYAGFNDATEVVEYTDKHEDFRIKIEDMAGDEIGNILDRFNELIENAKESDEPTIFIGTEIPQKEIDKEEEIDLTPEPDPFTVTFQEPDIEKQKLLLQEEIRLAREELEELELEEIEEEIEELEEEIEEEIIEKNKPPSIFKRVRNFFGF